jgi:hypothetical protein
MAVNKRLLQGPTGSGGLVPSENFKVVTFTGDGTSSKFIEVGFTPDFVWIKGRNASSEHKTIDSSRTAGCFIYPDLNNGNDCNSSHAVIETNGFNVKGNPNVNGREYVAWCWKANEGTTSSNTDGSITSTVQANTDAGFSIVKYTGTGSNASIGHNLGVAPEIIFIKKTSGSSDWVVGALEWTKYLELNGTPAFRTANVWQDTAPTSSVFTLTSGSDVNGSGSDYIAYAFASIDGFSKIGSYTGNGSTNGPIVETGFEPAFIMVKRTDASDNWLIFDNKRSPSDPRNLALIPNSSSAELTGNLGDGFSFLSNGFKVVSSDGGLNDNGGTYIYMAFAADPDTEAPTLADSFNTVAYTGNGSSNRTIEGLGFSPSLLWLKSRTTSEQHYIFDTIRGHSKYLHPNLDSAQGTDATTRLKEFLDDGFKLGNELSVNQNGEDFIAWAWKADDNEPTAFFNSSVTGVYKFEDNVNDVAGNNNGANGVDIAYTSSGKFNKAVISNGTNTSLSLSQTPPMTTAWTFSFWFYATESGSNIRIILQTGTGFAIGLELSKIFIFTGGSNRGSGTSISLNTWYHYAATYDGTSVKTYLNGSLAETITTLTGMSAGNLKLFDPPYGSWAHYTGRLDQLRVYSTGLSSTQITALYNESASDNDTVEFPDGLPNGSIASIVSANANAGFSIVKYTGTGSVQKIPHGLSSAPTFIIAKRLNSAQNWMVGHTSIGFTKYLELNDTRAEDTATTAWNDTAPTATTVTLGTSSLGNGSGDDYIMYCFHDVAGYSKIGSYTGDGTTTKTITTGFQPDFVLIKVTDGVDNWVILDSVRGGSKNIKPNDSAAEATESGTNVEFISTGFKLIGSGPGLGQTNGNGNDYIYMAFKIN